MGNAASSNRFNPPVGRISWKKKTQKGPTKADLPENFPVEGQITYFELRKASLSAAADSFRNLSSDSLKEISSTLLKARNRTFTVGRTIDARIKFMSNSETSLPTYKNVSDLFEKELKNKPITPRDQGLDSSKRLPSIEGQMLRTIRVNDSQKMSKFSVDEVESLNEDGEDSDPDQGGVSLDSYKLVAKTKKQIVENLTRPNNQRNAEIHPERNTITGLELDFNPLLSPVQKKREISFSRRDSVSQQESFFEESKQAREARSSSKKLQERFSLNEERNESDGTFALDLILLLKQYENSAAGVISAPLQEPDDDEDHKPVNLLSSHFLSSNNSQTKVQRSEKVYLIQNSQLAFKFDKLLKILSEAFLRRNILLLHQREKAGNRELNLFQQTAPGISESHILSNNYPLRKFTIYLKQSAQLDMGAMKSRQDLLQDFTVFIKREVFMSLIPDFEDLTMEEIFVCDIRKGHRGAFGVDFYLINLSPHLYGFVLVVLCAYFKQKYPLTFLDIQNRSAFETFSFSDEMIDHNLVVFLQKESVSTFSLHSLSDRSNLQVLKRNISLKRPSKRSFNHTESNQVSPEGSAIRLSEKKTEISHLGTLKTSLKERARSSPPPEGWLYFGLSARNKYNGNNIWLCDGTSEDDQAWVDCYCSVAGYERGSKVEDSTLIFRGSKGKSARAINLETYHMQDSLNTKNQQAEESAVCGPGIVVLNAVTVNIGTQKYFSGQLVKISCSQSCEGVIVKESQRAQGDEYYLLSLHCRAKLNQIKLPANFQDKIWVINDINSVRPIGILLKKISEEEARTFSQDTLSI